MTVFYSFRAAVAGMLLLVWTGAATAGSAGANLDYRSGYTELGSMLGVAGLAAGDIDGDGGTEILVGGTTGTFGGPGLFSVLRADAQAQDGYRQIAFSETFDAGLTALTLLDMQGDGRHRVVAGLNDGSVHFFSGTALVPSGTVVVAGSVNQVLLADADDDGAVDLVVLSAAAIALFDPLTLEARGSVPYGAVEIAIGDVDGDAHPEVVLNSGKVLRLSRSGSALVAQLVWTYPAGDFGIHVALADIDGDGMQELIAESAWDYLTVFDLDAQTPKWQINQLGDLDAMTLADVNGDGTPDAIVGSGQWGNETAIDLTNRQTLWSVPNPDFGTGSALVADVDGDGVSELLWTGEDHLFVYALPALTEKWQTLHVDGPFSAVAVQPVRNAGRPRVAFASSSSNSGYGDGIVWQWDASTLQPLTATMPDTFQGSAWTGIHALAYGGSDAEGTRNLLVGTDHAYDGAIYGLDAVTGAVQYQRIYDSGSPINALAVADLDGDGNDEIVAADYGVHTGSPGIYVYVFDWASGTETWRSMSLAPTFGSIVGVSIADLDGDAFKDIVAVTDEGGGVGHLFQFTGAGHTQWESSGTGYTAITTFDVDEDGNAEVIVGTQGGGVQLLDARSHAVIGNLQVGSGPVAAVRAYRDPATGLLRVASLVDDRLRVNDVDSGDLIAVAPHVIKGTRALEVVDADEDNQMDFFVGGETAFRIYRLFNDAIFADGLD